MGVVDQYVVGSNRYSKRVLKTEVEKFFSNVNFENPLSVTLTEKQHIHTIRKTDNGYVRYNIRLDEISSVRNTKHFLNRLNQNVFGNSFHRYGKRLKSFVVMEKSHTVHHHLHLILEQPNRYSFDEFSELINRCWWKTKFGDSHTHIQKMFSNGWLVYLLKDRTKFDLMNDIDWENTHIGS